VQQLATGESVVPELLQGNDEVLGIGDVNFAGLKPEDASRPGSPTPSAASRPGRSSRSGPPRRESATSSLFFGQAAGTGMLAKAGYVKISAPSPRR
jgi:hypothetical protein